MPFTFQPYQPQFSGSIAELIQAGPAAQARALQQGAAAQARAAEIGGQAKAQMVGSIAGSIGDLLKQRQDAPRLAMRDESARLELDAQRGQMDAGRQAAAQEQAFTQALTAWDGTPEKLVEASSRIYGPRGYEKAAPILKGMEALQSLRTKSFSDGKAVVRDLMLGLQALPEPVRAQAYPGIRQQAVGAGVITERDAPPQYDPAWFAQAVRYGKEPPKAPELIQRDPTKDLANPVTGQVVSPGTPAVPKPATVGSFEDYVTRTYGPNPTPAQIVAGRKAYQQADDRPRITVNTGNSSDVHDAVAGMKEGTLPPQLPGRASKEYVAIMAEAKRQGYDLATAATDWQATQKHISTLNGAQQTRMAQAIDNAAHSLDVIDDLAGQWKGGKFPILNSVQLKAAKQGVLGPEAQKIATLLEAQISDVTSELGNVYMGGNSPTDHALGLASKNLSATWTESQLKAAIGLARKNLTIRQNSMHNVGVAGASEANPYAPKPQASGTVKMKAPNGDTRDVPADQVEHYKRLGATVIP